MSGLRSERDATAWFWTRAGGRMELFVWLHAGATLLDATEKWKSPEEVAGFIALSLGLLVFGAQGLLVLTYLLYSTGTLLGGFPELANHGNLTLYVNGVLLSVFAIEGIQNRGRFALDDGVFDRVAPALSVSVALVYLLAGFHKLNTDFIHPDVSCAAWAMEKFAFLYGGHEVTLAGWLVIALAVATIVWELGAGVALVFKKTRWAALGVCVALHSLLSLVVFFDFSALMLALYVSFLPRSVGRDEATVKAARAHLAVCLISGAVSGVWISGQPSAAQAHIMQGVLYVASSLWVVAVAWQAVRRLEHAEPGERLRWRAVFPVLLVLFALQNYVGLRTSGTFSMFSNLRTETSSNHLLVRSDALFVADYQHDIVWMEWIRSSERGERLNGMGWPRLELEKRVLRWRAQHIEVPAVIVVEGVRIETQNLAEEPRFPITSSGWERALFSFRPIQPSTEPNACRW